MSSLPLQLLVYCLVRELPNQDLMDRIKETMRKYSILANDSKRATEEQTSMESLFRKRVIAMKGNSTFPTLFGSGGFQD